MERQRFLTLALLLLATGASPARATTVVEMTPAELAAAAQLIVAGDCTEVHAVWAGPTLVTLATYAVEETLKGPPQTQVVVALPGGIDSQRPVPVQMIYPGAPTAVVGEHSLLFLNTFDDVPGSFMVTGFAQGKFTLVPGANGPTTLHRTLAGLTFVRAPGASSPGAPAPVARAPVAMTYEQLKRELVASLRGTAVSVH